MLVSEFDFELPEELIAQHPPTVRGASRMLRVERRSGQLIDDRFGSLPELLGPEDLLVLNDSRVLPARLFATRAGLRTQRKSPEPAGRIEVLLTQQMGAEEWTALVRPGRKVQVGEMLVFGDGLLRAEVVGAGQFGERRLRFAAEPRFLEYLERIGHMPLPPYIHREKTAPDSAEDKARYQTVYAAQLGSAAAPTAGLHFTSEILTELKARGVQVETITLHVGLGTFQPVRAERVEDVRLHTEHYTLPAATAAAVQSALRDGRRIVAAGTTTTRTLEHCAATGRMEAHSGSTNIFIAPGHRFSVVGGLLTNFHLPQSTLLMLVSAFLATAGDPDEGRRIALAAYAHAIREGYRFFSYGDCMLVL